MIKLAVKQGKERFFPVFLLIFCLAFMPRNLEARQVRVGVFPAAPLVMVTGGVPDGLFIELLEYFAGELEWQLDYVEGTWNEHLLGLEQGEIDLLPALGYSLERDTRYDFSRHTVYIDSGVLFTAPDFSLHTVFDLQRKRVAGLKGSIFTTGFIDYISSFGVECEIILTKNNEEVMQAVAAGEADAGVCIYSLGNELARDFPVTITPISFSPIALFYAVPGGKNQDLLAGINRLMEPMLQDQDSVYSRLHRKWNARPRDKRIPPWFWGGMAGLLLLGLGMGILTRTLRQQVNLKTRHLEAEIAERSQAEQKLRQTLTEKETLIRELYHRTKNTMQVIRGMVSLQASDHPENRELQKLVHDTTDRIQAISLVHQMLYKSNNLSRISIKDYIHELADLILESFDIPDKRITLDIEINNQDFLLDTAIPVGLIINELMTNSLKHAFTGDAEGKITISLRQEGETRNVLRYADNGPGVEPEFNFRNQDSLGLKLIYNIGELQLMGRVDFRSAGGISCMIDFPADLYEARV